MSHQSGETKDVQHVVTTAAMHYAGITVMCVINVVGSMIARRTTKLGVYKYCHAAGHEYAVASMKAFTTQVTALALKVLWFRQMRVDRYRVPHQVTKLKC